MACGNRKGPAVCFSSPVLPQQGSARGRGYYLISQGTQRHHLPARLCTCRSASACKSTVFCSTQRNSIGYRWLCAAGVLGRRKMEKEENKGRLGPQQGGEAQAVGATSELLCDIPLYHKDRGPALSLSPQAQIRPPSSHSY